MNTQENRHAHLEMMARMVSHNLRSPMAGMKMLFSLYDMTSSAEDKQDLYENLKEGAQELFAMVEELSKVLIDYAKLIEEPEEVLMDDIHMEVVDSLEEEIEAKKATLKTDFSACESFLYYPSYLEFILKELFSNSLRFSSTERNCVISIRAYSEGGIPTIEFKDNGIGINLEKHKDQLFKMYKTFHNNTDITNRGVGLFTIKNQVEILGGKVSLNSKPEEGCTITLKLVTS